MFSFDLPTVQVPTCHLSLEGDIRFDPPIYEQRYATVIQVLEHPDFESKLKKIVEFGCSEMRLLWLLRRTKGIEHIVEVDVDEETLLMYKNRAAPIVSDHIVSRETPLRIEVFKGSIDVSSEYLKNTDAVIGIEIIEHLYPEVLENVPYNVFGFIQPKIALFSTPNSDFNVLFRPLPNGFRHYDHKFEWSQQQFKDWALNICERFPNYRVAIFGVGEAPQDSPELGPVSQFALFVRNDVYGLPLTTDIEDVPADLNPDTAYKEIYAVDFPMRHDDRTLDQKIWDEASFFINQYRTFEMYHNTERLIYQIPFDKILEAIEPVSNSADDLRRVLLENDQVIEDGFVVVPEDDPNRMQGRWSGDSDSNYDDYDYYDRDQDDDDNNVSNGNCHNNDEENAAAEHEEEECWD
ncbi:small RNA 2'-O-methyltransferase [Eupeodes corollae]|uniref:small RNA 2'-O-methyltransferase n=1 Tax=Eupeodes corollae TaxID=290404 RepID=UPI002493836E|nr:small RNA 2'-O-methyltransferase [Eupeodes corollae]